MNYRSKSFLLCFILGFIFLLLLEAPFIYGLLKTPQNTIYLGTVHYPPDYFGYLSFIAQGKDHILSSRLLYTTENISPTLFRWQFVLWGRVLSFLPIHSGYMYQLAVIFCTVAFFISAYWFICLLVQDGRKRVMSFFFFLSGNAWPILQSFNEVKSWGYHTYWFNTGTLFNRFGATPHHLLASALLIYSLILTLSWYRQKQKNKKFWGYALAAIVLSINLVSISPMQWVLAIGAGCGALLLASFQLWRKKKDTVALLTHWYMMFVYSISGLPVFLYLQKIYSNFPFTVANAWEATQQVHLSLLEFFYSSGFVLLFAAIGLLFAFFKRKRNIEDLMCYVTLFVCLWLFFGKVPQFFHVTNARFWPQAIYVILGVFAARGVEKISSLYKKDRAFFLFVILFLYTTTTLPATYTQLRERTTFEKSNMYMYLPKDIYISFMNQRKQASTSDIFLLPWPINHIFPGLTGNVSYFGDELSHMTINAKQKNDQSYALFDGKMSEQDAYSFLTSNNIKYIYSFSYHPISKYSFLRSVEHTNNYSLNSVTK